MAVLLGRLNARYQSANSSNAATDTSGYAREGRTGYVPWHYDCHYCNLHKGSDLASVDPDSGTIVPLFNPRTQTWSEHFRVEGVRYRGFYIPEGRTTVKLLQLNSYERMAERRELV